MENGGRTNNQNDDEVQAFYAMFVLLICVECSKEPEFRCENCDKVYKQEGRYHVHLAKCRGKEPDDGRCGDGGGGGNVGGGGGGACVSASEFTELLRQNREMMALLQKQQETIQTLVSQLVVVSK
jgi:hypothetical protein